MSGVKQLTYSENFQIDLSSGDALSCDGVNIQNGVLRGFNAYEPLDERKEYFGIVGVENNALFVHTNRTLRKYDGEFSNLMVKIPVLNPISADERYEIYRGAVYIAFDEDGVIRHDCATGKSTRWAFNDYAADIAVVNERLAMLLTDGVTIRFADCNGRLYSEVEKADVTQSVTLPSAVQAITRSGFNTLYALGDACYKLTFSAKDEDIKVDEIARGIGEVNHNTVREINGKIVFASKNKLYALSNGGIKRIFPELSEAVNGFDGCRASVWRGRYVLTVPYLEGRRAYVLDVERGKCVAMLCRGVVDVSVYGDKDVLVKQDGELLISRAEEYSPAVFTRSGINFGTSSVKYLRKLTLTSKYDVEVIITDGDGVSRSYYVRGGENMQSLNVQGKGRTFKLQIRSAGQAEVTFLSLTAETYKEVYYGD